MTAAVLSPQARRDVLEAVHWIAADNPAAARAFRDALRTLAADIGRYPESGVLRSELAPAPYRFALLAGFPYIAVYNATRSPPLILRVLHGARDMPDVLRDLMG
ncbi:MAG: type II toxin-antitoxin system RelE/ParE family toxin [Alphaproteobacteria bacterium]|nr:type II toxin-antitoxin system RelE/ParE family toxin [Alphaproteobacteria bacterium]